MAIVQNAIRYCMDLNCVTNRGLYFLQSSGVASTKRGCFSCSLTYRPQVFHTFRRHVNTNQRISFDVDPSGRYLATGSTERRALVYDIETQALAGSLENQTDAVGAVCFHPYAALLGVCTGQRHFDLDTSDVSDSDDSMDADMFGHDARDSRHEAQRQNVVAIHSLRQPGLEGGC